MRHSIIRALLAFALLCALLVGACAYAEETIAEETIVEDQIALFWMGDMPAADPYAVSLTDEEDFAEYLVSQMMQEKEEIDISSYGISADSFKARYEQVFYSRPELFFVSNRINYAIRRGYVTAVYPTYRYTGEERIERLQAFNSSVSEIARYARQADTDLGRLMLVNTYFCTHYEYDLTYSRYGADDLFIDKTGVCQAYMLAYCAVLGELRIPNTFVTSTAMGHAWNIVKLDGEWYHVDVTWNDPVYDVPLGARYEFFLLSDEAMLANEHYNWTTTRTADSEKYDDMFWRDLSSPVSVVKDEVYYVGMDASGQKNIVAYDTEKETARTLFACGGLDSIVATGKHIFYISRDGKTVQSVHHDGTACGTDYTLEQSGKSIKRIFLDSNHLEMFVSSGSNTQGEIVLAEIYDDISVSFDVKRASLGIGDTLELHLRYEPQLAESCLPHMVFSSSCEQIASVDENGLVTGHVPGVATITARYSNMFFAECRVSVSCDNVVTLPEGLVHIEDEAFAGANMEQVILLEGVTSIGSQAFRDCDSLLYVSLPDSLEEIALDAFDGCERVTLLGSEESMVEEYAQETGLSYAIVESVDGESDDDAEEDEEEEDDNWETEELTI